MVHKWWLKCLKMGDLTSEYFMVLWETKIWDLRVSFIHLIGYFGVVEMGDIDKIAILEGNMIT